MRSVQMLGLVLIAGLMACGTTSPMAESTSVSEPGVTNVKRLANTDSIAPVGSTVEVKDNRTVLVQRSEEVAELQVNDEFTPTIEARGGRLIIIYLTLGNTGNELGNMLRTQFQLVDSQGRKYDEVQKGQDISTMFMWLAEQGLDEPAAQIFPGGTTQTAKIFRVAPDAENLKLVVNEKEFAID